VRAAWRAADRSAAVRAAAAGWRAAGLIDAATDAAVHELWPRRGPAVGPVWRVLIFVLTAIGTATLTAAFGISTAFHGPGSAAAVFGLCGALLAVATELILERCAFAPTGAETATSLFSAGYLCASTFLLLDAWGYRDRYALLAGLPVAAAILAAAAWRWGFRPAAAAATAAVLFFAAQCAAPWLLWSVLATLIVAGATRLLATRDLAPSHRDGLELARAAAIAGLYCAVNYYAADHGWIRELGRLPGAPRPRAGELPLLAAAAGSALFPAALLAWGLRTRDRAILLLGVLAAACSLVTIRLYVHVAPLWAALVAAGAALAAAALLLERWLRAGRDGERSGFTAAPLYDEGRRERLLPLAAAAVLAPAARVVPEAPRGVAGGGGGFGGGGATGQF
jgi:hypothetical protein